MDKHIKLISTFGLLVALGAAALIGFVTAPQGHVEGVKDVRASSVPTTSQTLASPITALPVVVTHPLPKSRDYSKPARHISQTTTTQAPPPLTPEQEAKIPGPEELNEFIGSDYDLPSSTSTIEFEQSAP